MSDTRRASCNTLRQSALAAVDWINDDDNKTTVGLERKSVDRRLRRLIVETNKLERSLDRPMCVGVFGPSQAGKSYLVSVLARHGEEPLGARFDGLAEPLDFIHDINPGGDRESTGIVTRFSIRGIKSPPGYPVNLRLLSETDVIKIIGNCYFNDGDQKTVAACLARGHRGCIQGCAGEGRFEQAGRQSTERRRHPGSAGVFRADLRGNTKYRGIAQLLGRSDRPCAATGSGRQGRAFFASVGRA